MSDDISSPEIKLSMDSHKKGFKATIHGAGWLSFSAIAPRLLKPISLLFLARLLNSYDFGLVSMAQIFIVAIELFRDMGVGNALIAHRGDVKKASNTTFYLFLVMGLVSVSVLWLISGLGATFFKEPSVKTIIRFLSINIMIHSLSAVPQVLLQREGKWKLYAIFDFIPPTVSAVSTVTLAYLNFGTWSLVYGTLLGSICKFVTIVVVYPWRPRWQFDWKIVKELVGFGKWITLDRIGVFLFTTADNTYLARFQGAENLGYYTLPYAWTTYPIRYVIQKISMALFATLSGMKDLESKKNVFFRVAGIVSFLICPMYLFLSFNPELIVNVVLGPKWYASIPIVRWLALCGLMRALAGSTIGGFFWATHQPKLAVYPQATGLVVIAIGFLISKGGWDGLQIARLFTVSMLFRAAVGIAILTRTYSIKLVHVLRILFQGLVPGLISGTLTMIFVYAVGLNIYMLFALSLILFVNLYLILYGTLRFGKPLTLYKTDKWRSILKDLRNK